MHYKGKTVVILDQVSGYLQLDMLEAYQVKFDKRVIIAATIVERNTRLASDVTWHKIIKYDRSTSFRRILTWFISTFQMLWIILTKYRKAHIVAITNPPFSIFVPWIARVSYDVIIYDMYPDALVQYGYLSKDNWLISIWSKLNYKVFSKAKRVITLTEGMKASAMHYMPKNKEVEVIPLWSDISDFKYINQEDNVILQKTESRNKFVIVYSGNLGKTHPVEKLLELAQHLNPNFFSIIIIGDGAKKEMLSKLLKENNLPHVHLLPWQPIELLSHNLYAGNINVVTLDSKSSDLSIPSKTFNILSIGNPILGICSDDSELSRLIQKYNCGIVANPTDMKALAKKLIELNNSPSEYAILKDNSFQAATHFTKENAKRFL